MRADADSLAHMRPRSGPSAATEPALTDDSKCGCYLIQGGNQSTYFEDHRFFDFRALSQYAGVPEVIQDPNTTAEADVTSPYFSSKEWTNFWLLGNWNNSNGARADASVLMVNSPNNIYIETNKDSDPSSQTHLTLRTQRLQEFQTAAEIESASAKFKYLSVRMRARTIGAAGAITAMFTYRGANTLAKVQESDLEIRTSDAPNVIHCTNQPAYTDSGDVVPQATQNATMPGGLDWTDWAVHRMDWAPDSTTWYVNDVQVARIQFQTPHDESTLVLNAWSDGGGWTGNMSRNDAAYLQIQWLEVVFNNTEVPKTADTKRDAAAPAGCAAVCSIDKTPQVGKPVMLWTTGSGSDATQPNGGARVAAWWPAGVVAVLLGLLSTGLVI
ncbi:glycoside hydrolase family 16 protein [Thermothielavioides terrestris NRRL 8126]|uniref:Glycoside hydrolase family 16 protein n=1 Tax=Thermothielavioides terrestris (strain ATCC 38088 / NRRL 8126) TaxID=578455 RepID=G2RC82_THETT|nr:glycoside hydrolase family 16 protein [Thermothielavioides terrestris NRRL 8126]AEO69403.1 glycoside hydrolase family 16 protein [Thermothielavioides terrestris NRRL 8126]